MAFEYSIEVLGFLAFIAIFAGFVDAVAGGGGLLTVPALLLVQIPPVQALATNKLQASFGSFTASFTMIKKGQADLSSLWPAIISCFLGAALGALILQFAPPSSLELIIPIVISVICVYFLFAPNPGAVKSKPRVSKYYWRFFYVPVLGFYDGYFGPGAGMFYSLGEVALRGRKIIKAIAHAKVLNFTSNIASLIIFIAGGKVIWVAGLAMVLGQILGSYLGAHAAMKGGIAFIKPMIVIVCLAMLLKFTFDNYI